MEWFNRGCDKRRLLSPQAGWGLLPRYFPYHRSYIALHLLHNEKKINSDCYQQRSTSHKQLAFVCTLAGYTDTIKLLVSPQKGWSVQPDLQNVTVLSSNNCGRNCLRESAAG